MIKRFERLNFTWLEDLLVGPSYFGRDSRGKLLYDNYASIVHVRQCLDVQCDILYPIISNDYNYS